MVEKKKLKGHHLLNFSSSDPIKPAKALGASPPTFLSCLRLCSTRAGPSLDVVRAGPHAILSMRQHSLPACRLVAHHPHCPVTSRSTFSISAWPSLFWVLQFRCATPFQHAPRAAHSHGAPVGGIFQLRATPTPPLFWCALSNT